MPTIPRRKSWAAFSRKWRSSARPAFGESTGIFPASNSDHGSTSCKSTPSTPISSFAYTKGKNASDIALVIDAMDLLHSGRFDGFCLVSSDSDFTRLASRLREQGADVYGFGAQKTPESFRQACRRFIYTENLLPEAATSGADTPSKSKSLQPPSAAIPILEKAISQIESEDGWVMLGEVGGQISNLFSDFDVRSYGQRKLSDLVRKTGAFDVEKIAGDMRIRAKPADGSAKGKTR